MSAALRIIEAKANHEDQPNSNAMLERKNVVVDIASARVEATSAEGTGTTPLMRAALLGDVEQVRQLLSNGAEIDECRTDGFKALELAAFFGHATVVRELLAQGASREGKSRSRTSAEMWANARGFFEVADLLKSFPPTVGSTSPSESRPLPASLEDVTPEAEDVCVVAQEEAQEEEAVTPREISVEYSDFPEEGKTRFEQAPPLCESVTELCYKLDPVAPFSPFSALQDHLRTPRFFITAVVVVTFLAIGVMLAAVTTIAWRLGSQEVTNNTESIGVPPQSVSTAEATVPTISEAPSAVTPEQLQVQTSANNVAAEPQLSHSNVPASRLSATIPTSRVVERPRAEPARSKLRSQSLSSRRSAGRNLETVTNVQSDAPAPAGIVVQPTVPAMRKSRVISEAETTPLQGSSPKKKVIQWP